MSLFYELCIKMYSNQRKVYRNITTPPPQPNLYMPKFNAKSQKGLQKFNETRRECFASPSVFTTELKDDRIEKYVSLFVFISKKHCRATLKNLLADGRGG